TIGPTFDTSNRSLFYRGIHGTEHFANNFMSIGRDLRTHLTYRGGKEVIPHKDVSILCKEAENQAGHKMVHVMAAFRRCPIWVVFQKLHIELVQPACRADIERVFLDLLNRGDTSQR